MITLVLLLALQEKPADPPKITYEESGGFRLLVKDLEFKFAGRIRLGGNLPNRDVSVSVKDAGFYEVLDSLCRAYKDANYFFENDRGSDQEQLTVAGKPWVEYPAAYSGHFKTALVSMSRTALTSSEGTRTGVEAHFVLFAPPWLPVGWKSGARTDWTIDEALDADGRNLRAGPTRGRFSERIGLRMKPDFSGNHRDHAIDLLDFDLDRGLKTIAGRAKLSVMEFGAVRLDFKKGATAEVPQGKLTVSVVKEVENDGDCSSWIVSVTFTPSEKAKGKELRDIFGREVRHDGAEGTKARLDMPWSGNLLEIETRPVSEVPQWIELNVRTGERVHDIPFRLNDVVLKGK